MKTRRLCLVGFLIMAMSILTGWRSYHHKKHHIVESTVETSEPRALDLSLPLQFDNKNAAPITQAQSKFTIEKPKKIQREVELDTQAIMFAYPEEEKVKPFDGAAITINVKR